MIRALICPDNATALAISRGLYRISRPAQRAASDGDVTLYFAEVRGNLMLFDPDWMLPIHPDIVVRMLDPRDAAGAQAELATLLGPLLANPADLSTAAGLIIAGGTLRVADVLALLRPELIGPAPVEIAEG